MKTALPLDMIGYILISISIIGLVLLAVLGKKNKLNKTAKITVTVILAVVTIIGCFLSFGNNNQEAPVGEGGYEMPNESDDSFADYVQRVDPDLYDDMKDKYNEAVNGNS